MVVRRQGPDAMEVIGQKNPGIDDKGMCSTGCRKGIPQQTPDIVIT
jgi:hypothetical protein